MLKFRKFLFVLLSGVFSLSLFFSTGCSRHPNPEQISKMEEVRSACLAAEQKLSEIQKERADLESTLSSKKDELKGLQDEIEIIKQRLSNWKSE